MSVLTSTTIGTLELLAAGTYWVAQDTYYALNADVPREPRLVDMAGRHPAYVGKTPQARGFSILVYLLAPSVVQRMTDYAALVSACQSTGLIAVTWTENSVTRRFWCHVESIDPSTYMTRAAINVVAPNPAAEVTS